MTVLDGLNEASTAPARLFDSCTVEVRVNSEHRPLWEEEKFSSKLPRILTRSLPFAETLDSRSDTASLSYGLRMFQFRLKTGPGRYSGILTRSQIFKKKREACPQYRLDNIPRPERRKFVIHALTAMRSVRMRREVERCSAGIDWPSSRKPWIKPEIAWRTIFRASRKDSP